MFEIEKFTTKEIAVYIARVTISWVVTTLFCSREEGLHNYHIKHFVTTLTLAMKT